MVFQVKQMHYIYSYVYPSESNQNFTQFQTFLRSKNETLCKIARFWQVANNRATVNCKNNTFMQGFQQLWHLL